MKQLLVSALSPRLIPEFSLSFPEHLGRLEVVEDPSGNQIDLKTSQGQIVAQISVWSKSHENKPNQVRISSSEAFLDTEVRKMARLLFVEAARLSVLFQYELQAVA